MGISLATGHESERENQELSSKILNAELLEFLKKLHLKFEPQRKALLQKRVERQAQINQGAYPDFLKETANVRNDKSWKVAATPADLQKRWVEITGPTDRKMLINAFNSGADVFMADFEDANSPTWNNIIQGQQNLIEAIDGTISLQTPEGKKYALNEKIATLMVRPRGWHLNEKHLLIEGEEISASLFDFGTFFFHNAKKLIAKGSGPYFYLPKLESHVEARLWNDVFVFAQNELGIPHGTIRATVLIETILAAFEMEEILFELKDHSAGLNAGRWDYIFSIIKKFQNDQNLHLPDRSDITMGVPFMRAYAQLLVKTCHLRGAHAIGGMSAFIPNRKDPEATKVALQKVQEDKLREVKDGCDGTWVAHPDLVSIARDPFFKELKDKPNQKDRPVESKEFTAKELLNFSIPEGKITERGLRHNINIALQYIASWLSGKGAAAIYNLMEDAATAEISRAQVWQWLHNHEKLAEGVPITKEMIQKIIYEEYDNIEKQSGENFNIEVNRQAQAIFEGLVFNPEFAPFLTLEAYKRL